MSKLIPLSKGYSAIVDDEDYEWLSQWKWHARADSHTVYAWRTPYKSAPVHMHRVICETPDGYDTDHIDGNGLNNRRSNLRIATRSQNMWNRGANKTGGSSEYKGVDIHKHKWRARIRVRGRSIHIGYFSSEAAAAAAYAARAAIEFGEFNYLERAK